MILLQLNDLNKYYGAELILSKIKLELQTGDKVAIVGRNGTGKSTLLKIIAGLLSFDGGQVIKPKDVSIGYLAQTTELNSDLTIKDEMLTVFEDIIAIEKDLRQLELKMAELSPSENISEYELILKQYDDLQVKYKNDGGYKYEAEIRSVLHGLQFAEYDQETKVSSLSGGQKTRLALGKFLLSKPDILILDEPTNHLDIETLTWLEQYLQTYDGALLIVSHDRYFLDNIVHTVYEIAHKNIKKYVGNYSQFLHEKAINYERDLKQFERQQSEIAKLEDFIQRNIARASTSKRAQSRRKQLEKLDIINRPLGDDKSASFSFEIEKVSGNDVLQIENLSVGYKDTPVSKNISMKVNRGDSIALIGPNGVGKSTLLKTIVNKLEPIKGEIEIGTNVSIGYYDQELAQLQGSKTVLNELWDSFPSSVEKEVRTILGRFLFSGDDVLKSVSTLSGGERARLALAKLYMKKANLLILDEPTNHLDLESKEVLENALIEYPGTIIFVSHDRYFINRIASKVVELDRNGITEYLGDYDYFIEKKEELHLLAELENEKLQLKSDDSFDSKKLSYEEEKELKREERRRERRIEELEKLIEEIEGEISENEQLLCDPDIFQDHEKVLQITNDNKKAEEKLTNLLDEWTDLVEN